MYGEGLFDDGAYGKIRHEDNPKGRARLGKELDEELVLFDRIRGDVGDSTTCIIGGFCDGNEFRNLSAKYVFST
jgi:hypothetical protein